MSLSRYAKKRDSAEPLIIQALERAGWKVWQLDRPCDLLVWRADQGFKLLEVKTGRGNRLTISQDKRQQAQALFLQLTGVQVVRTPEEALKAVA